MEKLKSWILEDKSINFLLLHAQDEAEKLNILREVVSNIFPDLENIDFLELLKFWELSDEAY